MVDDRQYGTLVNDVYESVPDLVYPGSVEVYAQMRRDPQLAGVLGGYTLQLRRAQWQLDGTGCRPEVTRFVADCLGLPVAGDDRPSAFRRQGVSWSEHLRSALLCLVWGHYGFELAADVSGGRARLNVLAERIPGTIAEIHADPKTGALLGIDQLVMRGDQSPQIPAERLVWYCHDREGASWQGTSLLRPAYAAWLIKREMMRVNAISNRRWGAGVPVAEALPGTNPSPEQLASAQRMMSAARAGDQAGAATPPGFTMKIVGLSGSVPDTLGFIKFLNQEMSRSVLMQHMDLGSTDSGSRSLGGAFIDSWTLALESIGEQIADTATRQAVARVVDWNWGEDEPVPRVVVSGVGSRREVTAESLQLLLTSGALSADPALEAWVRREYRLPERTQQTTPEPAPPRTPPRPTVGTEPGRAGQPADKVAAAAPQPGDPVDYTTVAAQHEQAVADMTAQWEEQSSPLVDVLVAAAVAEVAGGMIVGLGALAVPAAVTAGLAAIVAAGMLDLAGKSAAGAAKEAAPLARMPAALSPEREQRIRQTARAVTDVIVSGYANAAARVALAHAGNSIDPNVVGDAVRAALTDLSTAKNGGLVAGNLSAAATTAQAAGREQVLGELPDGTRFRATEVLDLNTCGPCRQVDGREYDTFADALADYPTGKYRACEGRDRCRGFFYAVIPD
ncbi:phage portal protein family protein [Micromonospora carbonacea]|uniref:Phage portal protein n=1 Tax=Micromonospora carbonacea TaxID=47853 RepID=A0A1C5ACN3_9ACTN|nr:DUF935 family protein [Micromonospora carbonacea]SCF42784.1 Protein of unknown function (DUF935) [Micromonospora carbonacea]